MLGECLRALLACIVGAAIVIPLVVKFDKWNKEMNEEWKE